MATQGNNIATVRVEDIPAKAIIGVRAAERKSKQELRISIEVRYDAAKSARGDDFSGAVDYSSLARKVKSYTESHSFHLLEGLAQSLLDSVMQDTRIVSAKVTVQKPKAIPFTPKVFVEMSAGR